MGLGGFSTHDASYGFFDSPVIEAVSIVFMLIAGINFATHFQAFRERSAPAVQLGSGGAARFLLITLEAA